MSSKKSIHSKLIALYQEMSDLTVPECGAAPCRILNSTRCCEPMYCEMALEVAKDWGEELKTTDHPTLPLMGANGCVAPPHFRPLCTVHTCSIASLGFKKNDPAWTKKYFKLRERIDKVESERIISLAK